jgi:glycogen phosphorylase
VSADGSKDIAQAAADLEVRLPAALAPLARLAFNTWWSWAADGPDLFRRIDPERFEATHQNPVRLVREASPSAIGAAARDPSFVERMEGVARRLDELIASRPTAAPPIAFLCLEYGIHVSIPIYSGGLGILAGDILKEASDRGLPMVGLGLLYWQGSYHQRLDPTGWQHDYWTEIDHASLPMALVRDDDGEPVTVSVPVRGREVVVQAWRVDVGRVPLYLLDTRRQENDVLDRWITGRLYVGDPKLRLAQYSVLGIGGMRFLRALGIDPSVVHLNEGHPALATLELAAEAVADGRPFEQAADEARSRTVFTTHTPVAAGNETYGAETILDVLRSFPDLLGIDDQAFLDLGRVSQGGEEGFGMTTLALRMSRSANGVSRRHGEVARAMWRPLYPDLDPGEIPISHVTNGVHLPTWMGRGMRELLDRYLPAGWMHRGADPETWSGVHAIPDEELWETRSRLRQDLVAFARERSALDRLARGESSDSVEKAREAFDPWALTAGFARRVATYKRLYLLVSDLERVSRMLQGPPFMQVILAGKAHPDDEEAKRSLQGLFRERWGSRGGVRVTYLEDYDLALAGRLVAGCDLWINLPRPPLEASGTSGMKAALNGVLNLSVLDGWWAEAFDGVNGWAISGDVAETPGEQDERDAESLYSLMEQEVLPLYYDRDEYGVPHGWLARVKASLASIGPRFCASRMLTEYVERSYGEAVKLG